VLFQQQIVNLFVNFVTLFKEKH